MDNLEQRAGGWSVVEIGMLLVMLLLLRSQGLVHGQAKIDARVWYALFVIHLTLTHQGALASWHLLFQVGAPSLPNLLGALDALAASTSSSLASTASTEGGIDPAKFLSSLAVGA